VSEPSLTYIFYTAHENLKDEDNEIEEEEIEESKSVLFIWYLLASLKKMSLAKHGELFFI
jgi:hypothetical protein